MLHEWFKRLEKMLCCVALLSACAIVGCGKSGPKAEDVMPDPGEDAASGASVPSANPESSK